MRFFALICLLFAFIGCSLAAGVKSPVCGLKYASNGEAGQPACLAFITAWSYNPHNGKCAEFIYGGCNGNDNRFASKRECERTCA